MLVKGILKRVWAGVQYTLGTLPLIVAGSGLIATAVGGIGTGVSKKNAQKEFMKTEAFIERQAEDLDYIEKAHEVGFYNDKQYENYKSEIYSEKYVKNVLNSEGFEEYKEIIKNKTEPFEIALYSGISGLVIGGVTACVFWFSGIQEDIYWSAEENWEYWNTMKEEEEKRKKQEEEKRGYKEIDIEG